MESELSDLWCVLALPLLFVRSAGNGLRRLSSHDPQTQSTETFVGGFIFELEQILLSSITGAPSQVQILLHCPQDSTLIPAQSPRQ